MSVLVYILLALFVKNSVTDDSGVSQKCLSCLCETISGCDMKFGCQGVQCGPFKMSWGYWADGGKPTLEGEDPETTAGFQNCAKDPYCASLAVQGYMNKFSQDCNGDGKVDCVDYAFIHINGGYGCQGKELPAPYGDRFKQCKAIIGL